MRRITLPEIRRLFERQGLGKEFEEQEALLLWPEVAGPQMSRLTQPLRVRDGVLYVEAANPVVAQQLSLMKEAYLSRLNELLGEKRLIEVRFRAGRALRMPVQDQRAEGEQLSLMEREQVKRLLDELEDPHLREGFERWILGLIRRERLRAAQGWTRCRLCGVHHDGPGEICYYCKLEGRS